VLTTLSPGGRVDQTPLPHAFDGAHPLPEGLLLTATAPSVAHVLLHPWEEPRPVVADASGRPRGGGGGLGGGVGASGAAATGGLLPPPGAPDYGGWMGERVVWSCGDLPLVATYSEAGGRLALWAVVEAPPHLLHLFGDLHELGALTPGGASAYAGSAWGGASAYGGGGGTPGLTPMSALSLASSARSTPSMKRASARSAADRARAHAALPPPPPLAAPAPAAAAPCAHTLMQPRRPPIRASCRRYCPPPPAGVSIRTPDGRLTPELFRPMAASAARSRLSLGAAGLLPGAHPGLMFRLMHSEPLPAGAPPLPLRPASHRPPRLPAALRSLGPPRLRAPAAALTPLPRLLHCPPPQNREQSPATHAW